MSHSHAHKISIKTERYIEKEMINGEKSNLEYLGVAADLWPPKAGVRGSNPLGRTKSRIHGTPRRPSAVFPGNARLGG